MSRKSSGFDFKQFHINHDRSTMKVGTDAVLLAAWVNVSATEKILEIGTGCGVIALILAQRTSQDTKIDAIEPDHESAIQASENVSQSPWPKKIKVHEVRLQEFSGPERFELIITNPPYFINSQLPPRANRASARHTHTLSHQELILHARQRLTPKGRFAVVLPTEEGLQFQEMAKAANLYVNRQLAFFSRDHKPQERWLFEFSFEQKDSVDETLTLHGDGEEWSEAYKELTQDFYLHR